MHYNMESQINANFKLSLNFSFFRNRYLPVFVVVVFFVCLLMRTTNSSEHGLATFSTNVWKDVEVLKTGLSGG